MALRLQLYKYQKGFDKAMVWSLQLQKYQKGLDGTKQIKKIKACAAKVPKRLRQNQKNPNVQLHRLASPGQPAQPAHGAGRLGV